MRGKGEWKRLILVLILVLVLELVLVLDKREPQNALSEKWLPSFGVEYEDEFEDEYEYESD
ncbi:MAG: hypothetical protein JO308_01560 [Verrucomicrobia bacterium]|nr:hypothetical protein [Verrucomicrobiota bacterium]